MLFKDYHIPMIRSGSKTVTRREWSENYGRPNEGSVQIASDEMFTSDDEADCYIRILDVYDQPLGEMTDEDAQKEGDYEDMDDFREGYAKVYGENAWDPEKLVAVVEFEYVGRERPETDPEQKQLVTDGGQAAEDGRASNHSVGSLWRYLLAAWVVSVAWAAFVLVFGLGAVSFVVPEDVITANSLAITTLPIRLANATVQMDAGAALDALTAPDWGAPTTWVVVVALAPGTALAAGYPAAVLNLPGVPGGDANAE